MKVSNKEEDARKKEIVSKIFPVFSISSSIWWVFRYIDITVDVLIMYHQHLGGDSFKKTVFFGNFSQMADPTRSPFGNPLVEKIFYGLFCILGHKQQFCFSQKITFLVVFLLLYLGIGDPPSPLLGKLPKKYRFLF